MSDKISLGVLINGAPTNVALRWPYQVICHHLHLLCQNNFGKSHLLGPAVASRESDPISAKFVDRYNINKISYLMAQT